MTTKASACKKCGKKKCDAKIGPYSKTQCEKGSQAHHIVPDYTLRKGKRPKLVADMNSKSGRIKNMPTFNEGMSICVKGHASTKGTEHNIAHGCDEVILELSKKGKPEGTVSLKRVLKESQKSAIAAKPECEKEIKAAIKKQYKGKDKNQLIRGRKNAPKGGWSNDAIKAFDGNFTSTNTGF